MASQIALNQMVSQSLLDLKNSKVTIRTKSLDHIQALLNDRPNDLKTAMAYSDQDAISWDKLYSGLHDAIKDQCDRLDQCSQSNFATTKNKNDAYKSAISKCIDLATEQQPEIKLRNICSSVLECFENATQCKFFAPCYLKIAHKHILNSKSNLNELKLEEWTRLLQDLFNLYTYMDADLPKLEILQSIALLIEKASEYTYLMPELYNHRVKLIRMIQEGDHQIKAQKQLMHIIYQFLQNLALSYRIQMIIFIEEVLEEILKFYTFAMDEEAKQILFKVFHICLVIHAPHATDIVSQELTSDDCDNMFKLSTACDTSVWFKQMRAILSIVEKEVSEMRKQLLQRNQVSTLSTVFVNMAAKLCSMVFWDDAIWFPSNADHKAKRQKNTMQFQRLLDHIEFIDRDTSKFCWRWFVIFARIIEIVPTLLHPRDFDALPKLLLRHQKTIHHALAMDAFITAVQILLDREAELKEANLLKDSNQKAWDNIMDNAKKHAVSDKMQEHNLKLIGVFLSHKIIHSHAYIEDLINEITVRCNINKTNHSISVLIAVLRNLSLDEISTGQSLRLNIIKWLSSKIKISDLRKVISNDRSFNSMLVYELYVLCIFLRRCDAPQKKYRSNYNECDKHYEAVNVICETLQYRVMSKLIVCDSIITRNIEESKEKLPEPRQAKVFIDEKMSIELENALGGDDTIDLQMHSSEQFTIVATSLANYANILNICVMHQSMTQDLIEKSNFKKRIGLKNQQLNNIVGQLSEHQSENDVNEMIDKFLMIWHDDYHASVGSIVFDLPTIENITAWLEKQIKPIRRANSLAMEPLRSANQLEFDEQLQLKCLTLATYFAFYEHDDDDQNSFEKVENYEFNYRRNEDIFLAFTIAKVIIKHPRPPEGLATWAFDVIKDMCTQLHPYQRYMEIVIDLIPEIIRCMKFNRDNSSLFELVAPFLKQCYLRKYGLRICTKIISCVPFMAQTSFEDEYTMKCIGYLNKFVNFDNLSVQFACINALSKIFNKKWINPWDITNESRMSSLPVQEFHEAVLDSLRLDKLTSKEDDEIDRKTCVMAARLQLCFSIIGACYSLRKQIWFQTIEYCCHYLKMKPERMTAIVQDLCKTMLNGDIGDLDYLSPELLGYWIERDFHLSELPWYLSKFRSTEDYVASNIDHITWNILKYQPHNLPKLVEMVSAKSIKDIIQLPIIVKTLSFATAINVTKNGDLLMLKDRSIGVLHTVRPHIPNINDYFQSHALEIIEDLINNTWDHGEFREFFNLDVEYGDNGRMVIDYDTFLSSLGSIQLKSGIDDEGIIQYYCANVPWRIIDITLSLKRAVHDAKCDELRLCKLFRLAIWFRYISKYIKENASSPSQVNTVNYFMRDIISSLCNLITAEESIKVRNAIGEYFHKFCDDVLLSCVDLFKPHLNNIVAVIMQMVQKDIDPMQWIVAADFLDFLISKQRGILYDAIGRIDSFPDGQFYDEWRIIQTEAKYKGRHFSLREEFEWFLAIENHKFETLASLRSMLSTRKGELVGIYASIYGLSGFAEDCNESLIHRMIITLLEIVQNGDTRTSITAAKCLGEFGPSDLGSIVLKFNEQKATYESCKNLADALTALCGLSLKELHGLLSHSNIGVLESVTKACRFLLNSSVGAALADKEHPQLNVFRSNHNESKTLPFVYIAESLLDLSKYVEDEPMLLTHSTWISDVAKSLFSLFGGECLATVADRELSFSEKTLPILIKAVLKTNNANYFDQLATFVNTFFSKVDENHMNVASFDEKKVFPVYVNKKTIKSMLSIVESIRMHNLSKNMNAKRNENILTINLQYSHIAKAAAFCDAQFTAILYAELAALKNENQLIDETRGVLRNAYESIGEMDAVAAFLDPIKSRIDYLRLNNLHMESFLHYDTQPDASQAYVQHMAQAGLYNIAHRYTQDTKLPPNYESAWRLGDWDLIETCVEKSAPSSSNADLFDKHIYFTLKNLNSHHEAEITNHIACATSEIITNFKQTSLEVTNNVYKGLMQLNMLTQIEEFTAAQFYMDENLFAHVLTKWKHQGEIQSYDIKYREPILAQRVALLQVSGVRAKRKIEGLLWTGGTEGMMMDLVRECREESFYTPCTRYLSLLHQLPLKNETKANVMIEEAQLWWSKGEHELATKLMKDVISVRNLSMGFIKACGLYGEYLAETTQGNTRTIIENYLKESVKLSTKYANLKMTQISNVHKTEKERQDFNVANKQRNYRAIAKYADNEYQRIVTYKKSYEFIKKQSTIIKNQKPCNELLQRKKRKEILTQDESRMLMHLQKIITIDTDDIEATDKEHDQLLHLAIEFYLKSLLYETDDDGDISQVFRFFGLWISNQSDAWVTSEMSRCYKQIPSYKFVPLMPQITAHLGSSNMELAVVIGKIVRQCAMHHPHHVIPKIFALANAFMDEKIVGSTLKAVSTSPRTNTAKALLDVFKTEDKLRPIVDQWDIMSTALIQFANNTEAKAGAIPANELILKLNNLTDIHCPTVNLPIDETRRYRNRVGIYKWKPELSFAGGINAPKKLECIGSDGKRYPQLLKGKDDMRQDAVMQQVFGIVNNMLKKSKTTKKKRLYVRTYIVTPLSQRSGILEWCSDTIPITGYLVGTPNRPGAHQRLRPEDYTPAECREKLGAVAKKKFDERLQVYRDICQHFKPVFDQFFFENYHNPGTWFERRMAYAHSLATTSIIGYILGIGDRHISNILIDVKTAELIHIDFGIAFEQGKCLPTPETIPFRLTRDMIAGLGVSGVEGIFRHSCENTMEVLRQNKHTIVTLIEVLLHDPLYTWTLNSSEASKRQETSVRIDEDQDVNTMAERVLLRVEEKLDGKHIARKETATVKKHVTILINEATDDENLCRLFAGWQPYV